MLRRFELRLLAELGYALAADARCRHRRAGRSRRSATITHSTAVRGVVAAEPRAQSQWPLVRGATLLALAHRALSGRATWRPRRSG